MKESKRRILKILDFGYVNAGLKLKKSCCSIGCSGYITLPHANCHQRPQDPTPKSCSPSLQRSVVGGNGANKALFFRLQTFLPPTTEMIRSGMVKACNLEGFLLHVETHTSARGFYFSVIPSGYHRREKGGGGGGRCVFWGLEKCIFFRFL